jgi:hypothetical protein
VLLAGLPASLSGEIAISLVPPFRLTAEEWVACLTVDIEGETPALYCC